jgi:hypothetical protein
MGYSSFFFYHERHERHERKGKFGCWEGMKLGKRKKTLVCNAIFFSDSISGIVMTFKLAIKKYAIFLSKISLVHDLPHFERWV